MRIVAGVHRGRSIKAPKGDATRPTTDRVREALFSAICARIGNDLGAAAVLDAFAGSGALGLEALSRGAARVTFVEHDRSALKALQDNIADLRVASETRVINGDAIALAAKAGAVVGGPFALILLDPPYRLDTAAVSSLLAGLEQAGSVAEGALVTWEHASGTQPVWPEGFDLVVRKRYGTTEIDIAIYEKGGA